MLHIIIIIIVYTRVFVRINVYICSEYYKCIRVGVREPTIRMSL